jgi:hypothetical protein
MLAHRQNFVSPAKKHEWPIQVSQKKGSFTFILTVGLGNPRNRSDRTSVDKPYEPSRAAKKATRFSPKAGFTSEIDCEVTPEQKPIF